MNTVLIYTPDAMIPSVLNYTACIADPPIEVYSHLNTLVLIGQLGKREIPNWATATGRQDGLDIWQRPLPNSSRDRGTPRSAGSPVRSF